MCILQARKERGGGVAPRRNNRIKESATKENREENVKAKKTIQESNGKMTRRKDKTKEKGSRNRTRRTTKKEKKNMKDEKKKRKNGKRKGKRRGCPGGTMLILSLIHI